MEGGENLGWLDVTEAGRNLFIYPKNKKKIRVYLCEKKGGLDPFDTLRRREQIYAYRLCSWHKLGSWGAAAIQLRRRRVVAGAVAYISGRRLVYTQAGVGGGGGGDDETVSLSVSRRGFGVRVSENIPVVVLPFYICVIIIIIIFTFFPSGLTSSHKYLLDDVPKNLLDPFKNAACVCVKIGCHSAAATARIMATAASSCVSDKKHT